MTNAEKKQSFGTFRNAGYAAFHLAHQDVNTKRIIQPANPYGGAANINTPFADLWLKGWRDAEREHRTGVPFRSKPFTDNRKVEDRQPKKKFIPRGNFKPTFQKPTQPVIKRGGTYHIDGVVHTPKGGGGGGGVNLGKLEKKFNKKRTAV